MIFIGSLLTEVWVNLLRHETVPVVNFLWKFLSTLHVKVTSSPTSQEWCISFHLNKEFYELNLSAFSSIFDFPPSLDLDR